jgi:hypothetical protein
VQFIATSANNAPSMPRGFRVTMKGRQGQRRWWSLEVGVYRRIPYWQSPYTRIYLWHWGLTCAIYIYTGIVSSMQMGLESTDEVGGSAHYKVSSKNIGSYRADPVE